MDVGSVRVTMDVYASFDAVGFLSPTSLAAWSRRNLRKIFPDYKRAIKH